MQSVECKPFMLSVVAPSGLQEPGVVPSQKTKPRPSDGAPTDGKTGQQPEPPSADSQSDRRNGGGVETATAQVTSPDNPNPLLPGAEALKGQGPML